MKKLHLQLLTMIMIVSSFSVAYGQWVDQSFGAGTALEGKTITDVDFLNTTTGILVAKGASGGYALTTDGGTTWIEHTTTAAENLLAVDFVDATTIYAVGADAGFNNYVVIKSVDGGVTFTSTSLTSTDAINDLHFDDDQVGFVGGANGYAQMTVNGGTGWTAMNFPAANEEITSLSFVDAMTGYAATDSGRIYITTNGLDYTQTSYQGQQGVKNTVFFVNNQVGYAAAGTNIRSTTDGGTNWNNPQNIGSAAFTDIYFTDGLNGVGVGQAGTFITTEDGFASNDSDTIDNSNGQDMNAVVMLNKNLGWAVGYGGRVFKYFIGNLSGSVMDDQFNAFDQGKVYLILGKITDGFFPIVDSVTLDATGTFNFNDIKGGFDYLLRVETPNTDFLASYYPSFFFWQQAAGALYLDDDKANLDITMLNVTPPSAGGTGQVAGSLIEFDPDGKVMGPGDPLTDEPLTLINTTTGDINTTTSDIDGAFSFAGLPVATYQLYLDKTGVPVEDNEINITPTDSIFEDVTVALDTAENIIHVTVGNPSSVKEVVNMAGRLKVFPNPTSDAVNILLETNSSNNEDLTIRIYNVAGNTVQQNVLNTANHQQRSELDVTSLTAGMYIIEMTSKQTGTYNTKLTIMK